MEGVDGIMKDGFGFKNTVEWKKFDADGILVDSGKEYNQVQTLVKQRVIDALDTGSTTQIQGMAVGTGTGQGVGDAALASKASDENTNPTDGGTSLECVASFTGITGTVTEAGLFDSTGCTDDMYFYDDGLSVALTSGDTLQITWTVNCTG